ncbi:hypothetical protein CNMCM8980_002093 [Aspergillus fumigatiaffinis]|uniref:CN hydrolase domain-containing protein n=1 Tax=Aspergillus fumigatiaffinis TaxID=340414 RepID=A0A8H4GT95_9EURO|nr:hypothetical protein CNMCM5878_001642 [Aspergillus fumigatiaffinis]KAF4220551.1 hypothetical protein CNMCM6457_002282 [Aspergillus fumigatiaffinis]KAF4228095.1 hypothetical protein CNMCM6805_002326 [Aspergillus fumigatiaffinis]KAF4238438.1 hypothetical protein CNMCM8980_002093 [Aspergillus fumigatiaffinis]
MVFQWASRCLPGFSIIALIVLLRLTSSDAVALWKWKSPLPSSPKDAPGSQPHHLNMAQQLFVIYTVLVHVSMFAFTTRLAWALFSVTRKTKEALQRRNVAQPRISVDKDKWLSDTSTLTDTDSDVSDPLMSDMAYDCDGLEVIHAIIVPNYCEDLHTLRTTLDVLASHPRARTQYEIYLAMEQKEAGVAEKAAKLASAFEPSFRHIHATFHPANLPGEIAGKSSNVAFAARHIMEVHRAELDSGHCDVIVTVMDADTHFWQDYFTEIRRLHYAHISEADRTLYCCPIIFDRNSHETPVLVRCADLLWGFAGLSTMYPGTCVSIPTSVYSLPLSLAERIGGWDSDSTAIGEDMHMMLKCYFETAGNVVTRPVYVPASQCNVSSDTGRGWRRSLDTCRARYRQALRHMWGALDSGFAARRTISYIRSHCRCLFFRPRHLALVHLLWEAHFLPCHLIILMLFSTIYTLLNPPASLHPTMAWAFDLTNVLRASSFIGMNMCIFLYEPWHALCVRTRKTDMQEANVADAGFSERVWWSPAQLVERVCFPIAGTVFGGIPTVHAVFSHFWTDRLVYRDLAIEENHARACNYIRDAAAQGAELAVLPEYHLNGWAPDDPLWAEQAGEYKKYLSAYQALAKELHICLVPGSIVERHEAEADGKGQFSLYNTAYFISNDGSILGSYRKKNIWHPERPHLTSSGEAPHEVFDTPIGKVGLLICWDLAFPEAFRELIANGAEVVIIPTFWTRYDASPEALSHNPDSEALFLESTLTSRCYENTCAIVFVNAAGADEKFLGMSRVTLPIVGPVGKMGSEEGVLVVDMDMGLLKIAEDNYRVREDMAKEGWHYVYRHSTTK